MARELSPEKRAEYERLKRFDEGGFAYLVEAGHLPASMAGLYAESAAAIEANNTPTQVLQGLRMAATDMLEMTRHLSPQEVVRMDAYLESAGAPTLTEMRRRIWRKIPKILARGTLRSEEEYRLLLERVIDTADTELTPDERVQARGMVAEYEKRAAAG